MTTTTERAYGRMSWGLNPGNPEANAAWAKRMEHAALVLNRAADVFYAEAGSDFDSQFQAHPTHVILAAAALAMEMDGQGLHPCYDSFGWWSDAACGNEMGAVQDVVTGEEWQEIDDLAREMLAAKKLARIVSKALDSSATPLADMIAGSVPEPWDRISGGEVEELVRWATATERRQARRIQAATAAQGEG